MFWDIPVVCEPARGYPICLPLGAGTSHIAIHCVLGCHIAVAQTTGTSHLPHMGCPIQLFWDIPSSYSGTSHPATLGHPIQLIWDIPITCTMEMGCPICLSLHAGMSHPAHMGCPMYLCLSAGTSHPAHMGHHILFHYVLGCPSHL